MTAGATLKPFQEEAHKDLVAFLDQWASLGSIADAFRETTDRDYRTPAWNGDKGLRGGTPSVCLKGGTGAGKTLMAATWIDPVARSVAGGPTPLRLVLWLVPTKTLIDQTIRVLREPKGMYRAVFEAAFGQLSVISRETLLSVTPAQLSTGLTIVVSTAQGFRREDVEGLRAFRENGALMDHFDSPEDLQLLGENGEPLEPGEVVPSAVNVVRTRRPVVVVDEAHRNQSALSWQMLAALNPRFVLELTATPREEANVVHDVPPVRLKEEEMIRMPVNLYRSEGWMDALADAKANRDQLEKAARRAKDRIRPIALIQAEAKDEAHSHLDKGKVSVYDTVTFLTKELEVEREEIAIRTGAVDELSGRDLLRSDCPVRFVITVQAAAEGWDCPFATTLVAISSTRSRLQVTQLLGRCLRQDLARRSKNRKLNETYVFAATPAFNETAEAVVRSMEQLGFHGSDVVLHEQGKRLGGKDPETTRIRDLAKEDKLPRLALQADDGGEPQLLLSAEQLEPFAAKKLRLDAVDPIVKPTSSVDATQIDFDVDGKLVQSELQLPASPSETYEEFNEEILVDVLARSVRDRRVSYKQMRKAIEATVASLTDQGWTLSEMFGNYRLLTTAISKEMKSRYEDLLGSGLGVAAQSGKLCTVPTGLSAEIAQVGVAEKVDLSKHAYDSISRMNGEERELARDLSQSKKVKWWWRNPERTGWYLVGKWGRFFPDFVARLTDGRLVVLEYKGSQLAGNEDTDLKEDLGQLWESAAGSESSFYLVTKNPDATRTAQISPTELARNVLEIAA